MKDLLDAYPIRLRYGSAYLGTFEASHLFILGTGRERIRFRLGWVSQSIGYLLTGPVAIVPI